MPVFNFKRMNNLPLTSPTILKHYLLVRKWSSDIEFFNIETSFLHRLLDEYFLSLCNSDLITELNITGERLLKLEKQQRNATQAIRKQFLEMKWISTNMIRESKNRITEAQVNIGNLIAQVTFEFKEVKMDVFRLIEKQLQKNRQLVL